MDLFTQYKFLSGLRFGPQGDVAFLAAQADVGENTYRKDLWLQPREGEAFPLTTDGKTGGFLWDGPHTLLFQSGRDPEQKKRLEAGEEYTAFYRLDTRGGAGRGLPALRPVESAVFQGLCPQGQRQGAASPREAGRAGLPGVGRAALLL